MIAPLSRGTKESLLTRPCAFAASIGILKDRFTHALIPLVRTYIRYAPWILGKRSFWARIVDPYFAWHAHAFVASTTFGMRVAGDTRDIVQQYIYYFGVWEPNLTRWITRRLAPGDTFIDVGANIGYYSLLASDLVGKRGNVVAIEASPATFKILERNLELNHLGNVRAVNMAVYHCETKIQVFSGSEYDVGRTTVLENEGLKRGFHLECEVEAAPLSAMLRPEEARNARLIKVDVEGAEWSALQGMRPLLESGRSDLEIILEVNPQCLAQEGKRPEDLLSLLGDAGFEAYRLENDYSALSYLPPQIAQRPTRIRSEIQCCTDVIFSRQDADQL